jgi:hypothetical protein
MHRKTTLKSFFLTLALVVLLAPAAFARQTTVHFFVVPASVSAQKLPALNDFLVHSAGGFTATRSHGRGPGSTSRKVTLDNWSYTVAADKNLSREIMDYLKTQCGLPSVFMLVYEAERPGL